MFVADHQTITSISESISETGAHFITEFGNVITFPFQALDWLINKVKEVPDVQRHRIDVPTIIDIAYRIYSAFALYHRRILIHSSHWSDDVKKASTICTKTFFYPISFCRIGQAIQDTICEKILGNIAKAVSFIAFQVFHSIPYLLISCVVASATLLYNVTPIVPLTILNATIVYFLYRLVKEIELSNQILEEKLDQVNNGVVILKQTAKAVFQLMIQTLEWSISWVPKRR